MTPWCVLEVTCQTLPESSSSLQDVSWLGPWQIQAVFDNCLELSFLKPWNIDTFQSKFQAKRPETCQHAVLSMTILSLGGLSGLLQINRNHIWFYHGQPLVSCFGMGISMNFEAFCTSSCGSTGGYLEAQWLQMATRLPHGWMDRDGPVFLPSCLVCYALLLSASGSPRVS